MNSLDGRQRCVAKDNNCLPFDTCFPDILALAGNMCRDRVLQILKHWASGLRRNKRTCSFTSAGGCELHTAPSPNRTLTWPSSRGRHPEARHSTASVRPQASTQASSAKTINSLLMRKYGKQGRSVALGFYQTCNRAQLERLSLGA